MDNVQIIHSPKGEEMVILPRKEYDRLINLDRDYDEDAHDAALATTQLRKIKTGQTTLIPAEVVQAIAVNRVHPIKAWRDYRGWTGEELARKTKLARTTINQIETGKRKGTVAAYKTIAHALDVSIAILID